MINAVLLTSGFLFWLILIAVGALEVFLLTIADEDDVESYGFATAVAIVAMLAIILFTDAHTAFSAMSFVWLAGFVAVYMAAGAAWSIKKWYAFVVRAYRRRRAEYDSGRVNKSAPGNETFEAYISREFFKPSASENKRRIVAWMTLWPLSVAAWLMTWPRRAFLWVYDRLATLFDRITDRVWKGV